MKHEGSTFLSGCAPTVDFFFFAKELDELVQEDTPNSSFFYFKKNDAKAPFGKYDEMVGWPAVSMATVKPAGGERLVVAVGPQGDYWEVRPATVRERVGKIPGFSGHLRRLTVVEGSIFACGMGRVALRRIDEDRWHSFGPLLQKGDPDVVGFEDIGGFDMNEMYAVGWGGEIWWLDAGSWRRVDSPTSANLSALTCAADGAVYVVGHNGTMLTGRRDSWRVIPTGRTENLRDVAVYGGRVYGVSDFEILSLSGDELLAVDEFENSDDLPATCLHLLEGADGLVSLGTKDVFVCRGGSWMRVV